MMENQIFRKTLTTCLAILLAIYCEAQNLPEKYHFSDDGLRLIRGNTENYGFYNRYTVDTIFLKFTQPDYWTQLTNNKSSKKDILATLSYKGQVYDSVGVRFKGMTSYSMVKGEKKSFNITLDTIKHKQDIDGYTTLNLNNASEDASFLREFLYNYFQQNNVACAKTNFKVLYINGENWGLYVNVQQLNKQHAREWFTDADATRWRAQIPGSTGMPGNPDNPVNPGNPGIPDSIGRIIDTTMIPDSIPGGGFPGGMGSGFGEGSCTLNYLGDDTTLYQSKYTLKNAYKEYPWEDLVKATKVLNTVSKDIIIDTLSKVLDIDGSLWFLAHEILYTDDDSYINKGGMDYYVYFDVATNRIVPIEFDGNTSFVTKNVTAWSPFYKADNVKYPLMNILMAVPELRQRYLAHVRTILDESFNSTVTDTIIDFYSKMIDSYVQSDPKKIYTYNNFISEVTAIKDFVKNRKNYYLSNAEVNIKGASITNVIFKAGDTDFSIPDSSQDVKVNCKVSADAGVLKVYLYYDKGLAGNYSKVEMLDDAQHNDGQANDGVFGGIIPAHSKGKYVRFYIEAIANDDVATRSYSPAGAEHDVYFYRVKFANTSTSPVVLNEIMAINSYTASDAQGDYDDWIELYNTGDEDVDLSGYFLANGDKNLTKWQFPSNVSIKGKEYLIIWADNDTLDAGLHTNFKLSSKGEEVYLISPDTAILDYVTYSGQNAEVSFSRIPNGSGPFSWQEATYNSENKVTIYKTFNGGISEIEINKIQNESSSIDIYPNPASEIVSISSVNEIKQAIISVYNIYGNVVFKGEFNGEINLNVRGWSTGVYLVKVNNLTTKRLIVNHK